MIGTPLLIAGVLGLPSAPVQERRSFVLERTTWPGTEMEVLQGTFDVFENRRAGSGRVIGLNVVVVPATGPDPKPDPIFLLAGGPGQPASVYASRLEGSELTHDRDVVLVDQRGTGGSNELRCALAGGDDVQGYLDPIFQAELFRACLAELEERADLTQYSTPIAMDDLDEVRAALGYETVNLIGGSYGTRAALVYMRRHPESVRTAVLRGVAPIAFRNPLYHAREAQYALERTLEACAADPACHAAFPDLGRELETVLARLDESPARVTGRSRRTGEDVSLRLSREAFAEALRVMLYYGSTARRVPLAIHEAFEGDYMPFASLGITTNRNLREMLAFGMLLCVTCAEDVARIDADEVSAATEGTFLGDGRVRRQMEVCAFWPQGEVPEDYGQPVSSMAPTLLFSGALDPVTSPRFGAEAARHLPNSRHLVVPRSHDLTGPCIDAIVAEFLDEGSAAQLDVECIASMRLPAFELP